MSPRLFLAAFLTVAAALPAAAQPYGDPRSGSPYGVQGGELMLYEDVGFRGRPLRLRGVEPNLVPLRFNDVASSARSRGQWEVCEDINFRGRCWRIGGDEPDFVRLGFNDRVSSARPIGGRGGYDDDDDGYDRRDRREDRRERREDRRDDRREDRWGGSGGTGGLVAFYEHADFGGRTFSISDDEPDLNRYGIGDQASSIRVTGGAWRVCDDVGYRGQCVIVETPLRDLNDIRLNDRISSIHRIRRR